MRRVVMCGIPRSGSTLVWQIMRDLLGGEEVEQTHPAAYKVDGALAIVTIRNPHDVAASLYRVRLSRGGNTVGGPSGLNAVLARARLYFGALPSVIAGPHVLLRYEEFYDNHDVIFDALSAALCIEAPPHMRSAISAHYTLEQNRKRAARLADFNAVDDDGIHGDHIGPVLPGSWRVTMPEWGWTQLESVCGSLAKEWGYA